MFSFLLGVPGFILALLGALLFPERPQPAPPSRLPSAPDPDAPSAESQTIGHEVSDANPKVIGLFVLGLFAVIFACMGALGWMYAHLYTTSPAIPVKHAQGSFKFAPRAQTSIAKDWEEIDRLAHQRLDGYGWANRAQGTLHIPIARAVELVVKEGLPARAGQTPFFPPPDQEKLPLTDLQTTTNATQFHPH